jgi:hypothetical protein
MSARIRLRVVEFDDAPALAQLAVSQAEHLRLWEPRRAADYATASTQHDLVARSLAAYERGSAVPFLIVSDDDEIIGRVNVTGSCAAPCSRARSDTGSVLNTKGAVSRPRPSLRSWTSRSTT